MTKDKRQMGARLVELQRAAGYETSADFWRALGQNNINISYSTLTMMERGERDSIPKYIEGFARVLNCTVADFYSPPGGKAREPESNDAPPPTDDVEVNSDRYSARTYFRDVCQLVKEVYVSEGRPMPDFDLAEVAFDIVSDVPYAGVPARDVAAVQEALDSVRFFLRNPPFKRLAR